MPDPGASPFYPGPTAGAESFGPDQSGRRSVACRRCRHRSTDAPPGSFSRDTELDTNDLSRRLKIALRTLQKGESAKAAELLDEVLSADPTNHEALLGRATLALDGVSPNPVAGGTRGPGGQGGRADAQAPPVIGITASDGDRSLRPRAIRRGSVRWQLAGQNDKALAMLQEASDMGFDVFAHAENDESLASIRSIAPVPAGSSRPARKRAWPPRERIKGSLDKPLDLAFDFTLPGLDGKPVALANFKGKVVLVDFWGTWCGPCKEALPASGRAATRPDTIAGSRSSASVTNETPRARRRPSRSPARS